MFVYGNYPVPHSDTIFKALAGFSEDPIKQVAAIAFDKRNNLILAIGVNKVIKTLRHRADIQKIIETDKHPAKKFLMMHAEEDLVAKARLFTKEQRENTVIYLSTQPCMNCVKVLMNAGFLDIQWKEDNRHQDEQELIRPFMSMIKYKKNEDGFMLQVPPWLCKEIDLEKAARSD